MGDALQGIRVVDLTSGPVGGLATMVLADFGADVVKVEPPGGDRFRSLPSSPLWLRGKRSVALDLTAAHDLDRLHDLVATADVLVLAGPPSRADRWGVGFEAAAARRPGLVHCSITGWGPTGPLAEVPGYDGVVAARGGRMLAFERQLRRGGPVFSALPVTAHVAAQGAVQGIVAALIARQRGEVGAQRVETSLVQGLLPYDLMELLVVEVAARQGLSLPNVTAMGGDLPTLNYHPIRTADGRWIQCGNLLEHLLMACLDAMDLLGDLLADDRFVESPAHWSPEAIEVARDLILERALTKTADEWMAIFRQNGNVAAEVFGTTAEALGHPDVVDNGDIVELVDPSVGTVRTVGGLAELTSTPARVGRPAPTVGEHTDEVLSSLPAAPPPTAPLVVASSGAPLAGITVVEFATIIAAPLSTSLLADLGARVIRVEVLDGDPYRHLVPGGAPAAKTTAGKESICIDLKKPEGRAVARELALRADVLVHNYRPGVADRLGLGEADLRAVHPGLVWVSIAGYGRHSPSAPRPATHPCAGAAMGGAGYQAGAALTAPCDTLADVREIARQLIRANESNPDPNTSVVAASATLLALFHRERTGEGQAVYVNMLTANLYANADDALAYAGKPARVMPDAELLGLAATYRLYRAAAESWVFLGLGSEAERARFATAVGRPDLAFDDVELTTLFASRPADEWEAVGVAARIGLVRADAATPGIFFSTHPQMVDNGFSPETTHARFGEHRRWGPIVLDTGGTRASAPGVLAAAHTDRLLVELGHGDDVTRLRAAKVVASEPVAVG